MGIGACCRQEGGVGSCHLELTQHKVSEGFSEGAGECWKAAEVTEPEHFSMLYQTRGFNRNIQLCSVLTTFLSPKWKPYFGKHGVLLAI